MPVIRTRRGMRQRGPFDLLSPNRPLGKPSDLRAVVPLQLPATDRFGELGEGVRDFGAALGACVEFLKLSASGATPRIELASVHQSSGRTPAGCGMRSAGERGRARSHAGR